MTDLILLNKVIDDSGLKKTFIAERMGISPGSLCNKTKGKNNFKPDEIDSLCGVLHLNKTQRRLIFYPQA